MKTKKFPHLPKFTINTKLILLFVIVSIIPILVIGMISINISSNTMKDKVVQDSIARLEFIDYRMNELIREKHQDTLLLAYDDNVRAYSESYESQKGEEYSIIEDKVKRLMREFYSNQGVSSVLLVQENGEGLYYSSEKYTSVQKISAVNLVPKSTDDFTVFDLWGDPHWDGTQPVIPYTRLVLGETSNDTVAYLVVNIKESIINALYRDYEPSRETEYFIVNEHGFIQSCTDKNKFAKPISDILSFDKSVFTKSSGFFSREIDNKDSLITYMYNAQRNLYFIERIPVEQINEGFRPILSLTILVAVLCAVVCVILGYFLSRSFTKPIYKLIDRVSTFEEKFGGFNKTEKNEFVILNNQYEKLIEHLDTIIAEYYEEQQKKKEAEIRALEFQIKPHFLYNTLSTIIWLIEKNERKKAIKITKDLAAFFRISISKGKEYISIRDEMKHIELYINIQKARYEDSIFVEYDVPEELYNYYTPKLILQPLVENSINHAIQTKTDKTGIIKIIGRLCGQDIVFEVRDNGETITQDTIDEMNNFLHEGPNDASEHEYGIGISNVHDRVYMCFGDGYGLRFYRDNNETVASIKIKAIGRGQRNA